MRSPYCRHSSRKFYVILAYVFDRGYWHGVDHLLRLEKVPLRAAIETGEVISFLHVSSCFPRKAVGCLVCKLTPKPSRAGDKRHLDYQTFEE